MRYFLPILLVMALFAFPVSAAKNCGESTSIKTIQFEIEQKLMKRLCGPRAAVKAKDEYRFRLPKAKGFNVTVIVDKEKSKIPKGCRLGSSSTLAKPSGIWSSMIYVVSEEKSSMPDYNLVLKFRVSKKVCGHEIPNGYEVVKKDGKCFIRRADCNELCGPNQDGVWDKEYQDCRCTERALPIGVRG